MGGVMDLQEHIETPVGRFHVEIYRGGVRVHTIDDGNLIVNGAKNQLARLIGGSGTNRQITRIGFGIGQAAAAPGDTALTSAYVKAIGSVEYPATGQVRFNWSLSTAEMNGVSITEFGLLCADGALFSRKARAPIAKDEDLSLTGAWTIIF
jgi:hypothetical protein